jgi:hypothetical protein
VSETAGGGLELLRNDANVLVAADADDETGRALVGNGGFCESPKTGVDEFENIGACGAFDGGVYENVVPPLAC